MTGEGLWERIEEATEAIGARSSLTPGIGLILGTGLGRLADGVEVEDTIPYEEIPHFPLSTVDTHHGRLLMGHLGKRPVAALQGRFHLYEGYSAAEVAFPVRVLHRLGVRTLLVSNAAGGLSPYHGLGELMLIEDHINLQGDNPLIGPNDERLGPRFPDMSAPYSHRLNEVARRVALEERIPLHRGVYVAVTGPNLETRAEYRFLRGIGADVVGMSTVPEVIAAVHMGMEVLAFSVITDLCLPDALEPVELERIFAAAAKAEPLLARLMTRVVEAL